MRKLPLALLAALVASAVAAPNPAVAAPLPDCFVAIDEFLHVVRTHTLSAFDYLSGTAS